jgi:hypothetical protein
MSLQCRLARLERSASALPPIVAVCAVCGNPVAQTPPTDWPEDPALMRLLRDFQLLTVRLRDSGRLKSCDGCGKIDLASMDDEARTAVGDAHRGVHAWMQRNNPSTKHCSQGPALAPPPNAT